MENEYDETKLNELYADSVTHLVLGQVVVASICWLESEWSNGQSVEKSNGMQSLIVWCTCVHLKCMNVGAELTSYDGCGAVWSGGKYCFKCETSALAAATMAIAKTAKNFCNKTID